jgi:hypothetical protein
MTEKVLYDARGKQSNIARLAAFDKEGFTHMLFYRILIFYSIAYGVFLLIAIAYNLPTSLIRIFTAAEWILFTPQAFETVKSFSLILSRGLSFGHLSEEYTSLFKKKYKTHAVVYGAIPYVAMLLWLVGFVLMVIWWAI